MTSTPLPPTGIDPAMGARTGEPPSLRSLRPAFWFGGFNGVTWMVFLGTPMVLLAQHLGASPLQVGLASSFQFLLLPLQVVATASLPWLGFKRQMITAWLARTGFLLIPLGLAWAALDDPEPWMPNLLVASLFGFCVFRSFGMAAHMPWMAVIVPVALRGRFFATDSVIVSLVGVATLMSAAAVFGSLPPYEAFRIAYLAAFASSVLAVVCLGRLPAAPAPPSPPLRTMVRRAFDLCVHPGRFRSYLIVAVLGAVVTPSFAPFTVYYLKADRGLASSEIMLFTAAQFAGSILGAACIRHRIDRFPLPRFFQAAVLVLALVHLFWLAVLSGGDALAPWLIVSYFLFGLGVGMTNIAHFTYLPELAEDGQRPITLAIFTATLGLFSGLTPMLWGALLKAPGPAQSIDAEAFRVFFLVALGVSALLLGLYARLPELRPGFGSAQPRGV